MNCTGVSFFAGSIVTAMPVFGKGTHSPNLDVVPVNDGVYAHEAGPTVIRGVEVCQMLAVGVRPPSANEYRLHEGMVVQVRLECCLHRRIVCCESQAVGMAGLGDKVLDLRERMRGLDIDRLDGLRQRGRGGYAPAVQGAKVQDK